MPRNPKFPAIVLDVTEADAHERMKDARAARRARKLASKLTRGGVR